MPILKRKIDTWDATNRSAARLLTDAGGLAGEWAQRVLSRLNVDRAIAEGSRVGHGTPTPNDCKGGGK